MAESFEVEADVASKTMLIAELFMAAEDVVRAADELGADPGGYPDALARSRALAERAQTLELDLKRRYGRGRIRRCLCAGNM